MHGFEIFNGLRESRGCDETANVELWDQILTEGGQIWGVATDDFHCAYITPGHGWVMVQIPEDLIETAGITNKVSAQIENHEIVIKPSINSKPESK